VCGNHVQELPLAETDNIVLKHLRHIRRVVDETRDELREVLGTSMPEATQVHFVAQIRVKIAELSVRVDRLTDRVERIKRRLDLAEA